MDFELEFALEDAGIDAYDFSSMDDEERAEALEEAGLDPNDYEGIEFDDSFIAWSDLQDSGLSLGALDLMDEDEKREALEDAGLDPEKYEALLFTWMTDFSQSIPAPMQATEPLASCRAVFSGLEPKQEKNPKPETYRFCGVFFPGDSHIYVYRVGFLDLKVGDTVVVSGRKPGTDVARIVYIKDYSQDAIPFPVDESEIVLSRTSPIAFERLLPKSDEKRASAVNQPGKNSSRYAPNKAISLVIGAMIVIFLFFLGRYNETQAELRRLQWSNSASYSTSTSSSRSSRYSSRQPTCPPVNRELAMTAEEAERLSGTGYRGTRPNSSAEISALKAAQVRCKNCGYHSTNGVNSYCDYCEWMERYGGGLPAYHAPTATPRPVSNNTARPQTNDSNNASDYAHPDDFYYDHVDDFWDYEDAEDYWEEYN